MNIGTSFQGVGLCICGDVCVQKVGSHYGETLIYSTIVMCHSALVFVPLYIYLLSKSENFGPSFLLLPSFWQAQATPPGF